MNLLKFQAYLFLVFFLASYAFAEENCHTDSCECEQYRHLVPMVQQANEAARLNLLSMRTAEGRESLRLRLEADSLIPEPCRSIILASTPKVTIVARVGVASDFVHLPYSESAMRLWDAYGFLMANFKFRCSGVTDYSACISARGEEAYQRFREKLASGSAEEIHEILQGLGMYNPVPGLNPSDIKLIQIYDDLLNSTNEQAIYDKLDKISKDIKTDQKNLILQMWGKRLVCNYDNDRLNRLNGRHAGVVTPDELLLASQANTLTGFCEGNMSGGVRMGVCRDIAIFLSRMAQHMGFRNSYVTSMATIRGEYHVANNYQDPDEWSRIFHLNYEYLSSPYAGDSRALFGGHEDTTLNYRVFKPDGQMVADLPSEFGKFMAEAAGFDPLTLDPMVQLHGSMFGTATSIGKSDNLELRLGVGSDGIGNEYIFGGSSLKYGQRGKFPGRFSLLVANQERRFVEEDAKPGEVNLNVLYGQLEQRYRAKRIRFNPNLAARLDAIASLIFAGVRTSGGEYDGEIGGQVDMRLNGEASMDVSAWKKRLFSTYKIGIQTVPGSSEVRNNEHVYDLVNDVILNQLVFSARGRLQLAKTPEGRVALHYLTTLLIDGLGARGRAEIGLGNEKYGQTVEVVGRLSNDTAPFVDGSGRRLAGSAYWNPSKSMSVVIRGSAPLEDNIEGPELMSNLFIKY